MEILEYLQPIMHKLRFLAVGVLVGIIIFLISLLPTSATNSNAQALEANSSASVSLLNGSDSANAVTNSLFAISASVDSAMAASSRAANKSIHTVAVTSVKTSKATVRVFGSGLRASVHGVVSATAFTFSVPSKIMGGFSDAKVVRAMTSPADNSTVPAIDTSYFPAPTAQVASAATVAPAVTTAVAPPISQNVQWPLHGAITTLFGVPEPPYQPIHTGLDISDGRHSIIKPFKAGKVVEVVRSYSGLGNHVVIDHGNGITSVYAHLYSISVQVGQQVDLATTVGLEGSTGVSTGTHLHFEIRVGGTPVDPHNYIPGQPYF